MGVVPISEGSPDNIPKSLQDLVGRFGTREYRFYTSKSRLT